MSLTRRGFLGVAGAGLGAAAFAGPARADEEEDDGSGGGAPGVGTVVVVHLVGGLDGLSLLVPADDARYRELRPSIAIPPAGAEGGAIPFSGGWGLHPALAPLLNALPAPAPLAVVAGTGITDHWWSRSHVMALRTLHRGRFTWDRSGWAARALQAAGLDAGSAMWFGAHRHPLFGGLGGVMATALPSGVLDGYAAPNSAREALAVAYGGEADLARGGRAALLALGGGVAVVGSPTDRGYPDTDLGSALATTAAALHSGLAPRIVAVDHHGYDTHRGQGAGLAGVLASRVDELARSLGAFWVDLDARRADVTVVVVTEMGRTVFENRRGGTNHGTGSCSLVLDPLAIGGLHGTPGPVDPRADFGGWEMSTDVHQVLADVVERRGLDPHASEVLPTASPDSRIGLFAATGSV